MTNRCYMQAMATMIVEIYDALIDAGASEAKARSAASTLVNYESRFNKIESDMTLLKWMVGLNIGLTISIVSKLFLS